MRPQEGERSPAIGEKPVRSTGRMRRERLEKDDGRYIIFYTFEEEDEQPAENEEPAS